MEILNKIFRKNNKVKVYFIDALDESIIGVSKLMPDQLPKTFQIQTTMHLNGEDWSVVEAIPPNSIEFLESKELVLKVSRVEYINPNDILFTVPTISNEIPRLTQSSIYSEPNYSIIEDVWRQNEFLDKTSIPLIEIEVNKIENIKLNESDTSNPELTGYKNCHVRDSIGIPQLNLSLSELKTILKTESIGSLKMNHEFIANGFSLSTDSTTYYGVIENDIISQFCVGEFSNETLNEIQLIVNKFNLLFVNWIQCFIID